MQQVRPVLLAGLAASLGIGALVYVVVEYRKATRNLLMIDKNPAFTHHDPRTKKIRGIVVHHTVTGNPKITERVLQQRGFSTHFEVAQDGTVIRYLDPATYVAWASNWANDRAIAIDVTHLSHAAWPEVQVAAVARLVGELRDLFPGIPAGVAPDGVQYASWAEVPAGVGVLRHRNVHATECPQDFPMERLGPVAG